MKKLAILIALIAAPAFAQQQPTPQQQIDALRAENNILRQQRNQQADQAAAIAVQAEAFAKALDEANKKAAECAPKTINKTEH